MTPVSAVGREFWTAAIWQARVAKDNPAIRNASKLGRVNSGTIRGIDYLAPGCHSSIVFGSFGYALPQVRVFFVTPAWGIKVIHSVKTGSRSKLWRLGLRHFRININPMLLQ